MHQVHILCTEFNGEVEADNTIKDRIQTLNQRIESIIMVD